MNVSNGDINTNGNELLVDAGPPPGTLNLTNSASIQVSSSTASATLEVAGVLNETQPCSASVFGNLDDSGTYNFVDTTAVCGMSIQQGNYSQSGTLNMNIEGSASGANDRITASGSASLGGSLTVACLGTLAMGMWQLIQAGSVSGSFASVSLPPAPSGDQWWYGISSNAFEIALMMIPPSVGGMSPSSGPTTGGTVTISGSNFNGVTSVMFGSTPATSFTVTSSTQITAGVPVGSLGTVNITVSNSGGTSTTSGADQYTYMPPPAIYISNLTQMVGSSGVTYFTFTVNLTVASTQTTTVNFATADGTATVANGDYDATSGTLTFNPGQTTATITVAVNGEPGPSPASTSTWT